MCEEFSWGLQPVQREDKDLLSDPAFLINSYFVSIASCNSEAITNTPILHCFACTVESLIEDVLIVF